MTVCPSTNFIVLGRIAYLLMVEVTMSAFATTSNSKAKLSVFTTCLGVGKFAIFSCNPMLATVVSSEESTEVCGFLNLGGSIVIFSCSGIICGCIFDNSITDCSILDFHTGSNVNVSSGSIRCYWMGRRNRWSGSRSGSSWGDLFREGLSFPETVIPQLISILDGVNTAFTYKECDFGEGGQVPEFV